MRRELMVVVSALASMTSCRGPSPGIGSGPTSASAAGSPNTVASVATTSAGPATASPDVRALRDDARLILEQY